jgi:hypothetical protein
MNFATSTPVIYWRAGAGPAAKPNRRIFCIKLGAGHQRIQYDPDHGRFWVWKV